MKKLIAIAVMIGLMMSVSTLVMGDDSKEVLTLRRDLAQERVLRIQSQLSLMQQQFVDGQKYLQEVTKELKELNDKLKAMESPKPEGKGK